MSWLTILAKRENFRAAYSDFDVDRVAKMERANALACWPTRVSCNRLKVDAAMKTPNGYRPYAPATVRSPHGWTLHHPLAKAEWVKLFKKTFTFTGGEITGEFLISTGLPGAHDEACPV